MNFAVTGSAGDEFELTPGGADVAVDYHNRHPFERLLVEYRLNEFNTQCDAIRKGLATVVPYPLLSLFTWRELELSVCGVPSFDVALLKKMTTYEGCKADGSRIGFFWEMMENRLRDAERSSQFLKFMWERSVIELILIV